MASSEHFRKIEIASNEHFEYFVNFPRAGISLLLIGLTKSRAIEYMLTRVRACEELQKFCEHEQASTRLIFASNSSKGQFLRALLNWMGPFDTPLMHADSFLYISRAAASKNHTFSNRFLCLQLKHYRKSSDIFARCPFLTSRSIFGRVGD